MYFPFSVKPLGVKRKLRYIGVYNTIITAVISDLRLENNWHICVCYQQCEKH